MTENRKSYHHGDLRKCLVAEGLRLIKEKGLKALSLRAVARAAGVSAGAPYHHFQNRSGLLASIACDGFTKLHKKLIEVRSQAKSGEELAELGRAYASFAIENPDYFRTMFCLELSYPGTFPELDAVADPVFEELASCIFDGQKNDSIPSGNPERYILLAWSVAHGVSALLVDGPLSRYDKFSLDPAMMGDIVVETLQAVFTAARKAELAGLTTLDNLS